MRGISPTAQDAWIKDKPRPVPVVKSVPYKPIELTPPRPFTMGLILTLATGITGRPAPRYLNTSYGDPTLRPLDIVRHVAHKHGLNLTEIKSRRRTRNIVQPRQEAMWRLKKETTLSLPQIGFMFGGMDHTTVLHACRAHEKRLNAGSSR